jgi:GntR family transcriptional regulator
MWIVSSLPYLSPRQEVQADAWSEEAARAGRAGTQRIVEVATKAPPPDIAAALGSEPDAPVVLRRRVMLLDGEPVELVDSWYPAQIAVGTALATPAKVKGGTVTLLANLGWTVAEAREDITFRAAKEAEATELNIAAGTPVIVLFRICLASDGSPFEASRMVMIAEGRHLRYRLVAG